MVIIFAAWIGCFTWHKVITNYSQRETPDKLQTLLSSITGFTYSNLLIYLYKDLVLPLVRKTG